MFLYFEEFIKVFAFKIEIHVMSANNGFINLYKIQIFEPRSTIKV